MILFGEAVRSPKEGPTPSAMHCVARHIPRTGTYKQRDLLKQREQGLMRALKANTSPAQMTKAAEDVRHAQLQVLKAQLKVLEPASADELTDERLAQLESIQRKMNQWNNLTVEQIFDLYRRNMPPPA
jgi:hypothetical protein